MASKNENDRKNLTELEACVLALITKEGPCTAYSIRKQFEESLSLGERPKGCATLAVWLQYSN